MFLRLTAALLLIASILSCKNEKISNDYEESVYECGSDLQGSEYLTINNSDKERLEGGNIRIVTRSQGSIASKSALISQKGCVPVDLIQSAELVFIGANRIDGRVEGVVLTPDSLKGTKEVRLRPIPVMQPRANCHKKYIQQPFIDPMSFVSFDSVPATWSLFYSVNASIDHNDQRSRAYPQSLASLGSQLWNISFLTPASYDMKLEVFDHIRNEPIPDLSCPIDTTSYQLDVDVAAPIVRFTEYFDREFGVVDDGYVPNFYIREGLNNLDINYCIVKVDPEEANLPTSCEKDQYQSWKNSKAKVLDPGFYRFIYQASLEDLKAEWQTRDILVNKICVGRFTDQASIVEQGCNEIVGDVVLNIADDLDFELKYVSEISGSLFVERSEHDDHRILIKMPSLKSLGDLHLRYVENGNSVSFPTLSRISGGVRFHSVNLKKDGRSPAFPVLEFVSGKVDLHRVSGYEESFPSLKAAGGLSMSGYALDGFESLETVFGDLSISEIYYAKDGKLRSFSRFKVITGSLWIRDNSRLETVVGFEKLSTIGGGFYLLKNKQLARFPTF